MAGKNDNHTATQPGEIGTIRNILMGQQMAEYESHFARIEEEIAANKAHFTKELSAFNDQTDQRFQQLQKEMNDRFDRLEKLLHDHVTRLDKKLLEVTTTDKQNLGQMLADLSSKLIQQQP